MHNQEKSAPSEADILYILGQALYERAARELASKLKSQPMRPHHWMNWWQDYQPLIPSRTWSLCAMSMAHYLSIVPHYRGKSAARWLRDAAIRCEFREQLSVLERALPLPLRAHCKGRGA